MTYEASTTPTLRLQLRGVDYAYRRFGRPGAKPLIFLQRFRATMDDWDPALLDHLARERTVVLFDPPGVGRSNGEPAATLQTMASLAAAFTEGLGLGNADVLGFSLGGMVAQQLALDRPDLVDRIVIAGSGPGYLPDAPVVAEKVKEVRDRKVYADEDLLYLFFHDSQASQSAGTDHLQRLRLRPDGEQNDVLAAAAAAQAAAIAAAGQPDGSLIPRLPQLSRPTLIANGFHDRLQPVYRSFAMASAIPDAKLVLYPDAGHAFLFQYHEEFAREVLAFLMR
jgi:pimeloyl-ACP methyl ester carboxylesterase